jgi:hypothetical protein
LRAPAQQLGSVRVSLLEQQREVHERIVMVLV